MCPFMRAFKRLLIEFLVFLQSQPESKHPAPEAAKADLLVWAGMLSLSEWLRSQGSRVVRHSDTNFLLLTQQVSRMVKWMMEQVWGASFVFNKIYNTNFRNNVKFNDKKCKQIIHFDCIIFLQSTTVNHPTFHSEERLVNIVLFVYANSPPSTQGAYPIQPACYREDIYICFDNFFDWLKIRLHREKHL